MQTSYYHCVIKPTLPTELATQLERLCQNPSAEPLLDGLTRFICGADCPETLSDSVRMEWSEKQQVARDVFSTFPLFSVEHKRSRTDDSNQPFHAKRRRVESNDELQDCPEDIGLPIFKLQATSVTSPIRKKVDVTIHEQALRFTSLDMRLVEATVPLSSLRRAFLLPTRGKNKAHWTIVLIPSDVQDRGKPSAQTSPQVIFGIDAIAPSPLTTVKYSSDSDPQVETTLKGGKTLPSLKTFLSHLGIQPLEPTTDVFKSACSGYGANATGQSGIPGVEAYRAAKLGNLWFMKEGILWGESKPCEFWAVEDLLGRREGLRLLVHPGGRTCSLTLTRKIVGSEEQLSEDEEDVGTETEFIMIDAREQGSINQWVRTHCHLFGKNGNGEEQKKPSPKIYTGPMTIHQIVDEEDEEDDDFAMDSSDEDSTGSGSNSSGPSERDDGTEGSKSIGEDDEDNEEPYKKQHPLLLLGAVPRMSKAARDMVVGLVTEDFIGGTATGGVESEEDDEDELDE